MSADRFSDQYRTHLDLSASRIRQHGKDFIHGQTSDPTHLDKIREDLAALVDYVVSDTLSKATSCDRDLADVIVKYRVSMNNEIALTHWSEQERTALRLALKWFDSIIEPGPCDAAPSTVSGATCQTCGQEIPEAPTPSGSEIVDRFMAAMDARGYDVSVTLKVRQRRN